MSAAAQREAQRIMALPLASRYDALNQSINTRLARADGDPAALEFNAHLVTAVREECERIRENPPWSAASRKAGS